jgi:GLPGLI family protein
MKKNSLFIICQIVLFISVQAQNSVKVLAECSVSYTVALIDVDADKKEDTSLINAITKTVYIKGNQSRVEVINPSFSQSVLFDKASGNAVILREIGNNKFITKLNNLKWKAQNSKYDGAILNTTSETKTILGYTCKKAVLTLKDSSSFTIFYAVSIVPSVKEFEYQFKDISGFVLEYETQELKGQKVKYTATKINLNPVSASKFEIPTSGYRVLEQ